MTYVLSVRIAIVPFVGGLPVEITGMDTMNALLGSPPPGVTGSYVSWNGATDFLRNPGKTFRSDNHLLYWPKLFVVTCTTMRKRLLEFGRDTVEIAIRSFIPSPFKSTKINPFVRPGSPVAFGDMVCDESRKPLARKLSIKSCNGSGSASYGVVMRSAVVMISLIVICELAVIVKRKLQKRINVLRILSKLGYKLR